MGDSSEVVLFQSLPFEDDNRTLIWDNFTNGEIEEPFNVNKNFIFILGVSFLSSVFVGILLHLFYLFLLKKFSLDEEDDTPDGFSNPAYVDDESHPPANDHPPSYDSVMSGASEVEASGDGTLRDILRRFMRRKEAVKDADFQLEETPPSYSTAMANLQTDLSNQ